MNSRDAAAVAEKAWNATKSDEDPEYDGCAPVHKSRLLAVVESVENGVPSGIAGLDDYEAAVQAELAEPEVVDAEPLLLDTDALPEDFPGLAALEAAGITTYNEVRAVEDLTAIPGIGPATAEKITEALEEDN